MMKIWRRFLAGAVMLTMLAILTGCGLFSLESETQTLEQVESFTGAELPTEATGIYHEVGGFQDTIIWLRFDAAPDAVEAYLTALGFEEPLTDGGAGSFLPNAPKTVRWWVDLDAVEAGTGDFIGAAYSNLEANRFFQVLVDASDAELWRVYLIAFNT